MRQVVLWLLLCPSLALYDDVGGSFNPMAKGVSNQCLRIGPDAEFPTCDPEDDQCCLGLHCMAFPDGTHKCGNEYSVPWSHMGPKPPSLTAHSTSNWTSSETSRVNDTTLVSHATNSSTLPQPVDDSTKPPISHATPSSAPTDNLPVAGILPFNWGSTMPGGTKANGKGIDGGSFGPGGKDGGKFKPSLETPVTSANAGALPLAQVPGTVSMAAGSSPFEDLLETVAEKVNLRARDTSRTSNPTWLLFVMLWIAIAAVGTLKYSMFVKRHRAYSPFTF